MSRRPYYPIIYVRGYAMTDKEVEDTVATPYMGFNLGSTKYRQSYIGELVPFVFESPLIRLMKDHKYQDVYDNGYFLPRKKVPWRSIWIYRYYDVASEDLGKGERQEIEGYAEGLDKFIDIVKNAVCKNEKDKKDFKVYLVAHSMGGLICRCYLQKIKPDNKCVDKFFTYATPHGGIGFRKGLGLASKIRDLMDVNNAGNFGEKRMREFLGLDKKQELNSLNIKFPSEKVFCVVGTDSKDYDAAFGLSRKAVGPISDGLVLIENAYVEKAPRAYVHRSHSGHYGIVNSEEAYQNLRRFLFGDTRVKVLLDNVEVGLPKKKNLTASYYIENQISIRGLAVDIHRRTINTESAIFRNHKDLTSKPTHLFTTFLSKKLKVKGQRKSLGFFIHFKIVPQYHIENRFWIDDNYKDRAIFNDGLIIEVIPEKKDSYAIKWAWASESLQAKKPLILIKKGNEYISEINFNNNGNGKRIESIKGKVILKISNWNN